MLIKINYDDKNKSVYKCDKCGLVINNETLYRLVFDNKTYHLCNKHADILRRWLYNGK